MMQSGIILQMKLLPQSIDTTTPEIVIIDADGDICVCMLYVTSTYLRCTLRNGCSTTIQIIIAITYDNIALVTKKYAAVTS
jgi:hypothetical protein